MINGDKLQHMINYCTNKSGICRRKILFEDFHGCSFSCTRCKRCDVRRLYLNVDNVLIT